LSEHPSGRTWSGDGNGSFRQPAAGALSLASTN